MDDKTYCIVGDSVTQAAYVQASWVNLIKGFLESKYSDDFVNVFNLGIGGNTTDDVVKRLDNELQARNPNTIVVAIGVNDSGYFRVPSNPIVEKERFIANLKEIVKTAKKFTSDIVFVGLVLGDDSLLQPFPGSSKGKSYTKEKVEVYDTLVKQIAEESNYRYIHLMEKLEDSDFIDGLHPNGEGHKKMFEEIKKYL